MQEILEHVFSACPSFTQCKSVLLYKLKRGAFHWLDGRLSHSVGACRGPVGSLYVLGKAAITMNQL